ncbi:hypothetical protein AB5I41_24805 [Sphingomonas sp. MMS24-JH45]
MFDAGEPAPSRRALLKTGSLFAGMLLVPGAASARMRDGRPELLLPPDFHKPVAPAKVAAAPVPRNVAPRGVDPKLFRKAMAALEKHGDRIEPPTTARRIPPHPSSTLRFHLDRTGGADGASTSKAGVARFGIGPRAVPAISSASRTPTGRTRRARARSRPPMMTTASTVARSG